MVYYLNPKTEGIIHANSLGDGYKINLLWDKAYLNNKNNLLGYNIYIDIKENDMNNSFFYNPPVYFVHGNINTIDLTNFDMGQMYFFAVRALEYNPTISSPDELPSFQVNLKNYPTSNLRQDISAIDTIIPLIDSSEYPSKGIVKIGAELINYSLNDYQNNNLILSSVITQRGYFNTKPRFHTTDGYDGYHHYNPIVSFYIGKEEQNTKIFECFNRTEYPNFAFSVIDGYAQTTKDILSTDYTASDEVNEGFPMYDGVGYHRIDPVKLLAGECVGLYSGGQMYCADGYSGVGRVLRGISVQDRNNQRQEQLFTLTAKPVTLMKYQRTGIKCACVNIVAQNPDRRCPLCYGSKHTLGFEQFFNPRRSDGRILMRFGPADEQQKLTEFGMESDITIDAETLSTPIIKDWDTIIEYDNNGQELWRYMVLSVTRNYLFDQSTTAGQKLKLQRIRKTDVIYQAKRFSNTETQPHKINLEITNAFGLGPHTHTITGTNKPIDQWNQLTSINAGHNHIIKYNPISGELEVR